MKVLITGGGGQLGSVVCAQAPEHVEIVATVRSRPAPRGVPTMKVDLAERGQVDALFRAVRPDVVIHTAYSQQDLERDVVRASRNIAQACAAHQSRLIHLSTDALFSGLDAPYGPHDEPAPVHAYGAAKARAERDVTDALDDAAIVRTSLICSFEPPYGANGWIVDSLEAGERVTLFSNEIRCPILVTDLAAQLWQLAAAHRSVAKGIWHLVGPEAMSRCEVGRVHAKVLGLDESLIDEALSDPLTRPADLSMEATVSSLLSCRPSPIAMVGPHGKAKR